MVQEIFGSEVSKQRENIYAKTFTVVSYKKIVCNTKSSVVLRTLL